MNQQQMEIGKIFIFKSNSDNTINIKPINTDFLDINYANIEYISRRYTEAEVTQLCFQAFIHHRCNEHDEINITVMNSLMPEFEKWRDKYLK